ncbi:MAG: gamma-glutamyltransferase [Candidatus Odinarchaeota archaeon]
MFWRRWTGRSDIIAKNGIVASSQPLATQAGLQILQKGGNAVDAAVATAAVLDVVEPFSTGCGGDVFVLIHQPDGKKPVSINGSGRSGSLITFDDLLDRDWKRVPTRGGAPVTVPGALHAWSYIVEKYGALEFKEVLTPAIGYASDGFPVSPVIAEAWNPLIPVLRGDDALRIFSINGHAPKKGEMMHNPDLARTFSTVGEEGIDAFYNGEIAEAIVQTVVEHGGFLTVDDLSNHFTEETEALSTPYQEMNVYEHPPNGQGFAALEMLNIMEELDTGKHAPHDAERYHLMIEAKKLAYADLHQFNADPDFYNIPLNTLLSKDYARKRAGFVDRTKAMSIPGPGLALGEDTVYLATADSEGRAVSFINSLYMGFGSGLVAKGTGIKLQNRGALFSLDPQHPNRYEPGKKPFHTIIPGALYKEEEFYGVFGIMGGSHQAQAHAQFVSNVIDHQMSPQEAIEHPRFHHEQVDNTVSLENGINPRIQGELRKRGHVLVHETLSNFGGGQAIFKLEDAWIAGSDPRKDGQAAGY